MNEVHVIVETPIGTLEGHVQEDADLDGNFILIEDVTMKPFVVCGWQCDVYVE